MNRILAVSVFCLPFVFLGSTYAQKLSIVAISNHMSVYDYTLHNPRTDTHCNVYGSSANCTSETTQPIVHHQYTFTQVVRSTEEGTVTFYTLSRTATWVWDKTDTLIDGNTYSAEIKGKHMYITCRKSGNRDKEETIKFDIDNTNVKTQWDPMSASKTETTSAPEKQTAAIVSGAEPEEFGKVTVKSDPANAEILVDNAFVGNSPATVKLKSGEHAITINSDGFTAWTRSLTVPPGSELTLDAHLNKETGRDTTSKVAPEQLKSSVQTGTAGDIGFSAAQPTEWVFPSSGESRIVNYNFDGDNVYRSEDFTNSEGNREIVYCATKRTGDQWTGKCKRALIVIKNDEKHVCTLDLDVVITSITPARITGDNQGTNPPQNGELCPTPADSNTFFVNVPKTEP